MKDYQKLFLELALKSKSLQFGEFTLKSGRTSPYFFNAASMLSACSIYDLARCYVDAIKDKDLDFDCIYGPAYKGIFLGSIVATLFSEQGNNYPLSFNRKEEKDHGEGGTIVGSPLAGRALVIDDVITAGTAARESAALVAAQGATLAGLVVALDREECGAGTTLTAIGQVQEDLGVPVVPIVRLSDIISFLETTRPDDAERLRAHRAQYGPPQ